jgi:hypothetical protein
MNELELHQLFNIWIHRSLLDVGMNPSELIIHHFKFKSGERLTTLLFKDEEALKQFKKSNGSKLIQRVAKSTGVYTLIGQQQPVFLTDELSKRIPKGVARLCSIDILQGTMFGNQKSPGGILNQIIPFDLFE